MAEPGGARVPADPIRPGLRARLSSLQGHDTLCLPAGEIRELVGALDAARADVERHARALTMRDRATELAFTALPEVAAEDDSLAAHIRAVVAESAAALREVARLSAQRAAALALADELDREADNPRPDADYNEREQLWSAAGRIREALGETDGD